MRLTRTSDGTDSSVTEWRRREPDWSAGANDTSCSRVSRLLSPGPLLCFSTRSSPCLVLLPVGFALPVLSPEPRCALTAPFHPYRAEALRLARRFVFCGTFPTLASGGRYPPPCPVEPGLSSMRVAPHSDHSAHSERGTDHTFSEVVRIVDNREIACRLILWHSDCNIFKRSKAKVQSWGEFSGRNLKDQNRWG